MKTYTIPQKMSGTGTIHDIASEHYDRDIVFQSSDQYAVVIAAYYGGKGYSIHRTAAGAINAARNQWRDYSYVIIDPDGNEYAINGDDLFRIREDHTMSNKEKVQSIVINVRLWRDRVNGNTYHTALLIVNGIEIHIQQFSYGNENVAECDLFRYMADNGIIAGFDQNPKNGCYPCVWQYCQDHKINRVIDVVWVGAKKEMHNQGKWRKK